MKLTHILILICALVFTACSEDTSNELPNYDEVYTRLTDANLTDGDSIPLPSDDVILTISGDIGQSNQGDQLLFDITTLEQLGVVEYSVNDHQAEGEVVTFQGVLLKDLLKVIKVSENATTLAMYALNDYRVDIPIEDVQNYPVLLATSVNGERMSVERYGPTRIIYPTDQYNLDPADFDPKWIWQLARIEVN